MQMKPSLPKRKPQWSYKLLISLVSLSSVFFFSGTPNDYSSLGSLMVLDDNNKLVSSAVVESTGSTGSENKHVPISTTPSTASKHLPVGETLKILKDLGKNDVYNGGSMRCSKTTSYRKPELYWYDFSSSAPNQNSTKRILMAQSAGFGTYAQLLDLTAPINKAYARKWHHDVLVVQGTLVVTAQEIRTNCTPEEYRSTHNKMQLLQLGLYLRDHYDYLLILDADAMIFDFGFDFGGLLPVKSMLAAQRVVAKAGMKKRATWKINAGVTLWNLHHPLTKEVCQKWHAAALGFFNGRSNAQGDQIFLHHTLKSNFTYEENVYSVAKEFNYNKGTRIKHVKRPKMTYEIGQTGLDARSAIIAKFTAEICERFPFDCEDMDKTAYSQL